MATPYPTPEPAPPVVIVGAGSAGLAAAAALQRRGIHAVVVEQASGVATSWRNPPQRTVVEHHPVAVGPVRPAHPPQPWPLGHPEVADGEQEIDDALRSL